MRPVQVRHTAQMVQETLILGEIHQHWAMKIFPMHFSLCKPPTKPSLLHKNACKSIIKYFQFKLLFTFRNPTYRIEPWSLVHDSCNCYTKYFFYLSPRRRNPFSGTGYFIARSLEHLWFWFLAVDFLHCFVFFWVLTDFRSAGQLTRHYTTSACLGTRAPSRHLPSDKETR